MPIQEFQTNHFSEFTTNLLNMKKIILFILCLSASINSAFADHWTGPSANDFEDRAPLYVQLYLGQQRMATANDNVEIAAFINGEIRGQAFIGQSPTTASTLLEVRGNISADTGKTITFKVFYNGLEYELKKTEKWNYEASAHDNPFVLYLDPLNEVKLPEMTEIEGALPFTYDIGADITYVMGDTEQKTTETSNSKLVSHLTYSWDYGNSVGFFTVDDNNILTATAETIRAYLGLTVSSGETDQVGAAPTSFSTYTIVYITAAAVPPTSISVRPSWVEASIGDNIGNLIGMMVQNQQLVVTVLPENASDKSWDYSWVEAEGINEKGTIEAAGTYTVNIFCMDYPNIKTTLTIYVASPITITCPKSIDLYTTHSTRLTLTASGDSIDPSLISIEFDWTDNLGPVATATAADQSGLNWDCLGLVYGNYSYRVLYNGEPLIDPSIASYVAYVGGTVYIHAEVASAAGWDWISINALPARTTSIPLVVNGEYIDEIKSNVIEMRSQTQLLYNDPQNGLFGDITEMTPEAGMYKIKSQKGLSIDLGASVYSESTYMEILPGSQTMKKGYNWISYISCSRHSLESGWVENASNGDMIIGKDNFATYSGGTWLTSNTNPFIFNPGKGYIYYATGNGTKVNFNYLEPEDIPEDNGAGIRQISQITGWTVDASKFADNMTIIANLKDINNPQDYIVAAFVNGECRGFGTVSQSGDIFINVSGKAGENVEFRMYNLNDGNVTTLKEHLSYALMAGTLKTPVVLSYSMATDIDTIDISSDTDYEIFDASGRKQQNFVEGINILRSKDGKTVKVMK